MACSKKLRAKLAGSVKQVGEFDITVAVHTGIRSEPAEIAFDKTPDHFLLEHLLAIENIMRRTDSFAHSPGIGDRFSSL